MEELQLDDQIICFDKTLTESAYATIPGGAAEPCGCLPCLNFAAQRASVYPRQFRSLLQQIGIDPSKEGEVFDVADSYCGWFYFSGVLTRAGEQNSSLDNFEYWVADAKNYPVPPADFGDKVAAIEFRTRLPWVLPDQPLT